MRENGSCSLPHAMASVSLNVAGVGICVIRSSTSAMRRFARVAASPLLTVAKTASETEPVTLPSRSMRQPSEPCGCGHTM
jgi:hypothetical protein